MTVMIQMVKDMLERRIQKLISDHINHKISSPFQVCVLQDLCWQNFGQQLPDFQNVFFILILFFGHHVAVLALQIVPTIAAWRCPRAK